MKTRHTKYTEMYELYKTGLSLAQVGKVYGMSRQSVYSGFKLRKYILRAVNQQPYQMLDGIKFTLRGTGYYQSTVGEREAMHRYVWEKYNGLIPPNHDIHHVDHDKTNNDISNLELYTKSEHARLFSSGSNQHMKKPRKESVRVGE